MPQNVTLLWQQEWLLKCIDRPPECAISLPRWTFVVEGYVLTVIYCDPFDLINFVVFICFLAAYGSVISIRSGLANDTIITMNKVTESVSFTIEILVLNTCLDHPK